MGLSAGGLSTLGSFRVKMRFGRGHGHFFITFPSTIYDAEKTRTVASDCAAAAHCLPTTTFSKHIGCALRHPSGRYVYKLVAGLGIEPMDLFR
jgi:hypothetical protein